MLPHRRDILAGLSASQVHLFLAKCSERRFEPSSPMFSQGERHSHNYLIRSGLVRTYYVSPGGREITLAYWSAYDLIGGPSFFDCHRNHLWSAQAVEATEVLVIGGSDFRQLSRRIPAIAEYVIDVLTFKLQWISWMAQTMATESVHVRLAHLLYRLSHLYGTRTDDGVLIRYPFSQEELANMVAATRPWVSILLRDLQKNGIIKLNRRRIVICNVGLLREMGCITDDSGGGPLPL